MQRTPAFICVPIALAMTSDLLQWRGTVYILAGLAGIFALGLLLVQPLLIARYLPGFSVVKHRGRKSGTPYETIVTAYRKGNVLAIALAHGKTQWVKNVLAAGEADVHFIRKDVHITNPRVLPAGSDGKGLPLMAQLQVGRVGVFVADIT